MRPINQLNAAPVRSSNAHFCAFGLDDVPFCTDNLLAPLMEGVDHPINCVRWNLVELVPNHLNDLFDTEYVLLGHPIFQPLVHLLHWAQISTFCRPFHTGPRKARSLRSA